jgi:protein ImuA
MTSARKDTLARLQGDIARMEQGRGEQPLRVALGHEGADAALGGGIIPGVLHEVYAEAGHSTAATGFVAGLAQRLGPGKFLLWVRQDFSARENGELWMPGLAELGLDPRRIVVVRAHDAEAVLRVAADSLACNALGAVIGEVWGETRAFDLVASRKLTLAAQQSGVTALMLRLAAQSVVSTAETRWIVRAAHSPPRPMEWGQPVLATTLVRNRHGPGGHWIMEWNSDERSFRQPQAYPLPMVAAPADGPDQPGEVAAWDAPRGSSHGGRRQAEQHPANLRAG